MEEIRKEILLTYQEDLETIDKAEKDLRELCKLPQPYLHLLPTRKKVGSRCKLIIVNRQQKMELDFQGQYEVSLAKHTRKVGSLAHLLSPPSQFFRDTA